MNHWRLWRTRLAKNTTFDTDLKDEQAANQNSMRGPLLAT